MHAYFCADCFDHIIIHIASYQVVMAACMDFELVNCAFIHASSSTENAGKHFQTWPGHVDKNFQGRTKLFNAVAEKFYPRIKIFGGTNFFLTWSGWTTYVCYWNLIPEKFVLGKQNFQ